MRTSHGFASAMLMRRMIGLLIAHRISTTMTDTTGLDGLTTAVPMGKPHSWSGNYACVSTGN